jgi:hypothetical protein
LRRIKVWDEESERIFALLTNHVTFGAMTVTSIYKDRWQVEVFFRYNEAETEDQDICENEPECFINADWDGIICNSGIQVLISDPRLAGHCRIWLPCSVKIFT